MPGTPSQLLWNGIFGTGEGEVRQDFVPGGVVLFRRNLDPDPASGPARCHALICALQARWGQEAPLAVALDQEGGSVSRLRPWVGPTPSLRQVWLAGGARACGRWGGLWGRGLALLGVHVDFAPVADLWDPAGAAALGDRCASADPLEAALAAGAFLSGLERAGVLGCLKHYPGLGGLALDSHLGLPERGPDQALEPHLAPFRMLAHEDRLVMVAHLRLPLTGDLPASLCRAAVADNPWGVRARWLPDDLEMGGSAGWSWADRVHLCLEAGHMALPVCQTPGEVAGCARAAEGLPERLWRPAAERFRAWRGRLAPGGGGFSVPAWNRWVAEIRAAADAES
jgi:beta-N-acetylhexosaminidase